MAGTYWHKQTAEEPLFPELLWSRPENRRHAGKLLIIGGNAHGFAAPATAYQAATQAGIGTTKILLPDALQKTVGMVLDNGEFAPSTPSGSFSKQALAEWLDWSRWADGILLAGDLGRNSETAVAIEQFTTKTSQPLVVTKDAIDYFYTAAKTILNRDNTVLVLSLAQLQKLARQAHYPEAVRFDMGLAQLAEWLHEFSSQYPCGIMTYHNETILVAAGGQVSSTKVGEKTTWRADAAAQATVWWLQNPAKLFESLTTSII